MTPIIGSAALSKRTRVAKPRVNLPKRDKSKRGQDGRTETGPEYRDNLAGSGLGSDHISVVNRVQARSRTACPATHRALRKPTWGSACGREGPHAVFRERRVTH